VSESKDNRGDPGKIGLEPLFSKFIFERDPLPEGKVIIPDTVGDPRKIKKIGTVVAVGPGRIMAGASYARTPLEVGMRVYVMEYKGEHFQWKGKKYLLLDDISVLSIIHNEEGVTADDVSYQGEH